MTHTATELPVPDASDRLLALMNQPDSDSTDTTPQHSGTDNATEQHVPPLTPASQPG